MSVVNNPVVRHAAAAVVGVVGLSAAGFMSTAVSAGFFDDRSESLVQNVAFGLSALAGAGVCALLPGIAGNSASRGAAALVGLGAGAGAKVAMDQVWQRLL